MNILFELEDTVRKQFAENPYDEKMYLAIKALTEKILVVKNLVTTREDVDQVAHDYAIHLWLRICTGVVIDHWTKYIQLNISSTLYNYYKSHNKNRIEVTIDDPVDKDTFITTMYGASNKNEYVRRFEVESYLLTLYEEILKEVLQYSRSTDIVFNRRLYLSVLTNLFSDKALVGLSDEYAQYVEFICRLVRKSIYEKSLSIVTNSEFRNLATLLQIDQEVLLSGYETKDKKD